MLSYEYRKSKPRKGYVTLLAKQGSSPIGYVAYAYAKNLGSIYLQYAYVIPEFRETGVFSSMLEIIKNLARAAHIHSICWDVFPGDTRISAISEKIADDHVDNHDVGERIMWYYCQNCSEIHADKVSECESCDSSNIVPTDDMMEEG